VRHLTSDTTKSKHVVNILSDKDFEKKKQKNDVHLVGFFNSIYKSKVELTQYSKLTDTVVHVSA
jgi:hypothetical protein